MTPLSKTLRLPCLAALLAFCTSPLSRAEILIDCGDDEQGGVVSPVQDGWVSLIGPSFSVTTSGATISMTAIGTTVFLDDRDRAGANGGGTEAEFWRDFIFANGSSANGRGLDVAITGLQAATIYPIALWAFDKSSGTTRTAEWAANDGGGVFVPKGEFGFDGAAAAPTTLDEYSLSFEVTTDAAGAITLRGLKSVATGLATSHNVFLNGFRIGDPTPTVAPTILTFSATTVVSGVPVGSLVGTLTGGSTLPGDTFSFQLVAGEGDTENSFFTLSGAGQREVHVASSLIPLGALTASIRVRVTNSQNLNLTNSFVLMVIDDSDADGLLDPWEMTYFPDLTVAAGSGDNDADTVNNVGEYTRGSNPTLADTDGDTLNDAVETKTGTYVSLVNTGTDPAKADTDGDGFEDAQENPTQPTLGLQQPGTNPNLRDMDGDGYGDRYELAWPSNPKSNTSLPLPTGLLVDFTGAGAQASAQTMNGYQPYLANHEVIGEVDHTQSFPAFGSSVILTVAYPDSTVNTVRQLINRAAGTNANYVGEKAELMRDWIGIDARTISGGNGLEVPTTMTFTLGALPAGRYQYRAYHHDTELQHGPFTLAVKDASGPRDLGAFAMTASTTGGNNPSPANPGAGQGPETLTSTVSFNFISDGANSVVITYRNIETTPYESFLGVNGFELTVAPAVGAIVWKSVTRATATGMVTLEWISEAGANYSVETSPTLATGSWVPLGPVTATGSTATFVDAPPAATLERHYRIVRP